MDTTPYNTPGSRRRKTAVFPSSESPLFSTLLSPATYKIFPGADTVVVLTHEFAIDKRPKKKLEKEITIRDAKTENKTLVTENFAAATTISKG